MSPGDGGAIYDAPPKLWPQPAPSANATRHRQRRRRRERSVATINSCPTSYDESAARLLPPTIPEDCPDHSWNSITIIVVLAIRECSGATWTGRELLGCDSEAGRRATRQGDPQAASV